MELGRHLGKALWGAADKALPVAYGVAYVLLVIRVLPEAEFGNFVLVQEIFLIISGLATAFALQPMLKYASEKAGNDPRTVGAGLYLHGAIVIIASLVIVLARGWLASILQAPALAPLLLFIPVMLAASFLRNFTLALLQSHFRFQGVFWTDAVHFLGAPLLTWGASRLHLFDTARDLIVINIISLSASSFVGLIVSGSLIRLTLTPGRETMRKMYAYGTYSLGGIISYLVYSKADTFILSAFAGTAAVAVYNSAKVFTRIFEMMSQVVQMFVLPAVSRLSASREFHRLQAVVEKATCFGTLALFPVFAGFLLFATPLVTLLYSGKYADAATLLQVFSALGLLVPIIAVASNTLMGIGEARLSFLLSIQLLVASLVIYVAIVPWLGALGATIGYVLASAFFAWISTRKLHRFVPISALGIILRVRDVNAFIHNQVSSAGSLLRR
jgi:lipopolysaccharide exporter